MKPLHVVMCLMMLALPSLARAQQPPDPRIAALDAEIEATTRDRPGLAAPIAIGGVGIGTIAVGVLPIFFTALIAAGTSGTGHGNGGDGSAPFREPYVRTCGFIALTGLAIVGVGGTWLAVRIMKRHDYSQRLLRLRHERDRLLAPGGARLSLDAHGASLRLAF